MTAPVERSPWQPGYRCPGCGAHILLDHRCGACGYELPLLTIRQHGQGWVGQWGEGNSSIAHTNQTWKRYPLHPAALVINTQPTDAGDADLTAQLGLATAGPMGPDPRVRPGYLHGPTNELRLFQARPAHQTPLARSFGNASALDIASVDVSAHIALACGGSVRLATTDATVSPERLHGIAWELHRWTRTLAGSAKAPQHRHAA